MFVEVFNDLLAENDMSKKKFSEQSGIPYPTIIGWTNLHRLPDYTALLKIADFFSLLRSLSDGKGKQLP